MKKQVIFIFALLLTGLASADILINEVMPHSNNSLGKEWIELYNNETSNISLINWTLTDSSFTNNDTFSLNISAEDYALIVDNNVEYNNKTGCEAVYEFLNNSNFSCFEIPEIGNGLNDSSDGVYLFDNSTLISNFSWGSDLQLSGKSWSYNGSIWLNCTPTPGLENNCTQTCTPGTACTNSSCSNNIITQTCITTYSNCSTTNSIQNFSCSSNEDEEIYLELEWDEDDIVNGKEFDITVKAYNLESGKDYDIKVEIQNEDEDTISETYGNHGEDEDNWETSKNYLLEFFSGSGDKSDEIKLRIDSNYEDFSGEAIIIAKIRETGSSSIIDEFEDEIKILEGDDSDSGSSSSSSSSSSASGTITLGSSKNQTKISDGDENSMIYKSTSEYIKEYAPYAFSLLCIFLVTLLLMDKYKIRIRIEKAE